jgi:hypothetical protein
MRSASGRSRRARAYWCPVCKIRRNADLLEEYVRDRVLDIARSQFDSVAVEPLDTSAQDALEAELAATMDLLMDRLITADQARPILQRLADERATLHAAIEVQAHRRSALGAMLATELHWDALDLDGRRALIRRTALVTVLRVGRGARLSYGQGVKVEPHPDLVGSVAVSEPEPPR